MADLTRKEERPGGKETVGQLSFLDLPDLPLRHVFSFLPIAGRMRARVNKKLKAIEANSKYYVNDLVIGELCAYDLNEYKAKKFQCINFSNDKSVSSDYIKKLSRNTEIGNLEIQLSGLKKFHREIFNLIKEFDIGTLEFCIEDRQCKEEIMVSSFILDIMSVCKTFRMSGGECFTAEVFHDVYKIMYGGSSKFRRLDLTFYEKPFLSNFLGLIGIIWDSEQESFHSDKDIEVIVDDSSYPPFSHIFDGNIEIEFNFALFTMKLHESREALEDAKNKLKLDYDMDNMNLGRVVIMNM